MKKGALILVLSLIVISIISLSFVSAGWEYNTSLGCFPPSPGAGYLFVSSAGLRSIGGVCQTGIGFWKRPSTQNYEYRMTTTPLCDSTPLPGFSLKNKIRVDVETGYTGICLWEKPTSINYDYNISHWGGGGCNIDLTPLCDKLSWTIIPGYNIKDKFCVFNGLDTCTASQCMSDLCLWEKENTCGGIPVPAGCVVSGDDLICTLSDGMVEDTYITNWPGQSGYDYMLWLGCNTVGYSSKIAFKINNLNNYPNADNVKVSFWNSDNYRDSNIDLKRIASSWDESSTTFPDTDSIIIDSVSFTTSNFPGWKNFTITSLYNQWKSGTANYGFALIDNGCPAGALGVGDGRTLFSSENSDSSLRPKIIFEGACGVSSSTCPDSQVIMKLSDNTNAHGALWNSEKFALQLREHKDCTNYNPDITFSKITGQDVLKASSTVASLGNAYVFAVFDKSFLNGKKLKINWSTIISAGYTTNPFTISILDGEYDKTSTADFFASAYPNCGNPVIKGKGTLQTIFGTPNANKIDATTVSIDSAELEKVTIFITFNDAWEQQSGSISIYSLEILDQANNVLMHADLSGNLVMEKTGTLEDYGTIGITDDYPVKICYPNIFGSQYTGANPHNCKTGNANKVVGLSDSSDAHAETPDKTTYTTNVCYGDLSCEKDTSAGNSCTNGGQVVVRLYQETNSHLSTAADTNYPIKICCKPRITKVEEAFWKNMKDENINSANLNDRVKLSVTGTSLAGKINYTIYKSAWYWFDSKVAQSSGYGFTTWRANSAGTYYFEAVPESGGVKKTSGNLVVSGPEDNSVPHAEILTPKDKQIYFINENLNFSQNSHDEDDNFNYTWDLGDGIIRKGDSMSMDNYNFMYAYNKTGQKNIVLIVIDERGSTAKSRVSILIVNSTKESFAYIDKPEWGESIGTRLVPYDSSSSYAVNSTLSSGEYNLKCLAGACPSQTEGCPPPDTNYPDCQIPVDGGGIINSYSPLTFFWEFLEKGTSRTQTGDAGVKFTEPYYTSGVHRTKLTVTIN